MQTQWPGVGTGFDFSSLDASAGNGRAVWTGGPYGTGLPPQPLDSIARNWWNCGTSSANGTNSYGGNSLTNGSFSNGLLGIVSGLLAALQQIVGALTNGNANTAGQQQSSYPPPPGGAQQRFANVDVSSTGDPHIAETGTTAGPSATSIDDRWDSMSAHNDLVHSNDVEGGYQVSTAVTAPGANGVTYNQSATVHANFNQDAVTMNRDGSYAIYDDGNEVQLGKGESATLSGGERVDVNQDGSLTVNAMASNGGTISTTLRSTGAGVDVTAHGQNIALGGDAVTHGAPKNAPAKPHHSHHHRAPAAQPTPAPPPAPAPDN